MSSITPDSDKRILFVYDRNLASFMSRDWDMVRRHWPNSEIFRWRGWHDYFRLGHQVARADLVLCWFGASHTLATVLTNAGSKPVVIIAGGWDVANLPDIDYGAYTSHLQAAVSRFMFARATKVLAVSKFTRDEVETNARVPAHRIDVVHHGFDPTDWPLGDGDRSLDVLMVLGTHSLVKGFDLVVDTAARMLDVSFEVAGFAPDRTMARYVQDLPANLKLTGYLDGDQYHRKLQSAKVYFQPSRQESFGCAVAEAMLSGCIPVLTRRGAMVEVGGDAGYYVDHMLPQDMETAIRSALAAPETRRTEARQQIESHYNMAAYEERFVGALEGVMKAGA
jgi:glycosyltransferase involved in cell wall biosynthesis